MHIMSVFTGIIDLALQRVKNILTVGLFEDIEKNSVGAAEIAAAVGAVVGFAMGVVLSIKMDSLVFFIFGIFWPIVIIISYYIGFKLQNACNRALSNNPSEIGNQEYLDVVTLLNLVGAFLMLAVGAYFAIKLSSLQPLMLGLGLSIFCLYLAWQTLHPSLVTTFVQDTASAGMEAIAIMVLNSKIILRSNKILFGLLPTLGAILMLNSLFKVFGNPYEVVAGGFYGLAGFILVVAGLLSPLILYIAFIFGYMFLDVVRSLLGISRPATPVFSAAAVAVPSASELGDVGLPPGLLRKLGLGLIIAFVVIGGIIKGKEFYRDYEVRAEQRRVEEAHKKAEEDRLKAEEEQLKAERDARLAAENARKQELAAFASHVRTYVGKPAIDLVLNAKVNEKFKKIFGGEINEFEKFFAESGNVAEADGVIYGKGCRAGECGLNEALAVVDPENDRVFAVLFMNGQVKYFGISESDVPSVIKKLIITQSKN